MEQPNWRSPRQLDEELRGYTHRRFEKYMQMVDDGILARAVAITAFQDEVEYYFWNDGEDAA